MSSNWRVPGITILPHVCGIHSCPNIMNSKHPTFTFGTALLPPFTAASPTSVTVTEVTADFSGCSGARNRRGERNLRLFEVQIIWGSDYIDFFLFSCELTLRWSKWWQSTALSASAAAHASAPWRIGALAKGWWAWLLLRRPFSMCIRAKSWFRMHSSTCACTDQRQKCEYHCNDVHMISGRDLSKRDVLHLLMPLVTWRACLFLRYCHIRNVRTGSETIYAHSKE